MENASESKSQKPRLLLITPPFTQLNTPYPATAYLTGFLQSKGIRADQADLSIETALALFSRSGLSRLFSEIREGKEKSSPPGEAVQWALMMEDRYLDSIDAVIRFLQGADPSLAALIGGRRFLPEGPRFANLKEMDWAFGSLGFADRAKHLASLYLDDLNDLIRSTVDPRFGLSRYAERLATSAVSFDTIHEALKAPPGLIDRLLEDALDRHLNEIAPDVVGITVPFPGNLYGALRAASLVRRRHPKTKIILGGGFVNTELREFAEPRLFDAVDYVTLDAGEIPLLAILDAVQSRDGEAPLCRTFVRRGGRVEFINTTAEQGVPFEETGTPTYRGLPLKRYISILEMLNPMHRLWSDGRWNKLTVAHGCYWKKCAFCDVGLDYIKRYEPAPATLLADRIEALVVETGESGFHFVDEAAPPSRLADLALELLDRGRVITWWGNIRFEENFSPDLCRLLAASGCIAVTGGMEVAADRLLALMEKGIDVAQVARVADAFTRAGILVHAYLMYGFPTETARETIESLERVRQLFKAGILHSAFWHRFTATRHSPVGLDPGAYGITITGPARGPFANNDLTHFDSAEGDTERFGPGLAKAIYNYMLGSGLSVDVRRYFDFPVPKPKVPKDFIRAGLRGSSLYAGARAAKAKQGPPMPPHPGRDDSNRRVIWLGGAPSIRTVRSGRAALLLPGNEDTVSIEMKVSQGEWLLSLLSDARPRGRKGAAYPRLADSRERYPASKGNSFGTFIKSREWEAIRATGLLLV